MAMYKPNNFYPYQQEVDMESVGGNIFSCQVNTDGGLASGARVKILSASDNIELYENVYQFEIDNTISKKMDDGTIEYISEVIKTPYRNKESVDLPIDAYEIFPKYTETKDDNNIVTDKTCILSDISFQALCGNNFNYEQKKYMCPYNLHMIKKNSISYFKIIVEIKDLKDLQNTIYESIDIENIKIETKKNNLFDIHFYNVDDFSIFFSNIDDNFNYRFFITLKNGYDYLWNVRLYEHYFDENFNNGTFVSDGYLTGTTKNIFWYNHDVNREAMKSDYNVKKNNFLEVIATSENSNIFQDQIINNNKITTGQFQYDTDPTYNICSKDTNEYLLSGKEKYFFNGTTVENKSYKRTGFSNDNASTIMLKNFYNINEETKQIVLSEAKDTWDYETYRYYEVAPKSYYKDGEKIGGDYEILQGWYFLNNVEITFENNQFNLNLEKASMGESVYYYNDNNDQYILTPDVRTYVIVTELKNTELNINNCQEIIFNDKTYYARVLTPMPFNSNNYQFQYLKGTKSQDYYQIVMKFNNLSDNYYDPWETSIQEDATCYNKEEKEMFRYNSFIDPRNTYFSLKKVPSKSGDFCESDYPIFPYFGNYVNVKNETVEKNTYRIKTFDGCVYGYPKLYYHLKLDYFNQYQISGYYDCFIHEEDKNKTLNNYNIKYKIYDKNNPHLFEEEVCELVATGDNSSVNKRFNISIDTISANYENPYLEICFEINRNKSGFYIYDMQILSTNNYSANIFLANNSVDISEYIENMYLRIADEEDTNKTKDVKIKKYNRIGNSITLEDQTSEKNLLDRIRIPNNSVSYELIYKQREKITWVKKDLGFNQNINKIETENEFNIDLKDGAIVHLYPINDKSTYNSFFGVQDSDLNIDNIYIRFPKYNGKDALNNQLSNDSYGSYFTDTDGVDYYEPYIDQGSTKWKSCGTYNNFLKGEFFCSSQYRDKNGNLKSWSSTQCPIELYGTKVRDEKFNVTTESGTIKNKLFKITSYDPNTGEIVIAIGLERIILPSDEYEIWEKEIIEGSNNEYDITEAMSTYTRLYPPAKEYAKTAIVSQSEKLIPEGIKILNSNNSRVFIQPNVNFSSDNNTTPYLILDATENKLSFPYDSYLLNSDLDIRDITFEKLDNSQWLINYISTKNNDLIPGMTYKLYTDWADSFPSSYFYARKIGEIELKYGESSYVDDIKNSGFFSVLDYDNLRNSLYDVDNNQVGDNCVISGMNIYFIANIKNINAQIKKYRYKIYNDDMELLWDSTDIWDNIMEYEAKGIQPNEIYYLVFECEDEYGYQYYYEKSFYSQYELTKINNDYITLKNLCYQNAVSIKIDPELFKYNDALLTVEDIQIYRTDSTGKRMWINSINLELDKIYTGMRDDEYVYGFVDYGVYNNEYYDYLFVFSIKEYKNEGFNNYEYIISYNSIKTAFDSWTIVNIEKNQDFDYYNVTGDIWSFKYNLENSEIINNTSVTTWNTLGQYGQLGSGVRGYDSSGLTCLLGDVGEYTVYDGKKEVKKYGYHEKITTSNDDDIYIEYDNPRSNNIDKYKKWKKFCRTSSMKLLKDLSGNLWIVGITENPSTNIHSYSREQMKTISFQWMECMDSENISILGKLTSYDRKGNLLNNAKAILEEYWYLYEWNNDYTEYSLLKIKEFTTTLEDMTIYGHIVSEGISGYGLLRTDNNPFQYNEDSYNNIKKYIFESNLKYTDNKIDNLFKDNLYIESIDIIFNDNIQSAINAFSGCKNLSTEKGRIEINTSNYINTSGMLDGVEKNITIKWNESLTNQTIDLLTYAELYEQYWNKDNISLDCPKMSFNIDEWEKDIDDESGTDEDDGIRYDYITYLSQYIGNNGEKKENIFIPKYYKENSKVYKIILSDNFVIE